MKNYLGSLIAASRDLRATKWDTFRRVIVPLSMNGVRSGVQAVFIPSLSLFMLTRLIGGNRVITLGTAVEQHFLSNAKLGNGFYQSGGINRSDDYFNVYYKRP